MSWNSNGTSIVSVRVGNSHVSFAGRSVGLGGVVDELHERDRGALFPSVKLDAGAFIHRNGSLLASVQVSQAWSQTMRMTIYPGMLNVGGISPGLYTGVRGNDLIVGVSFSRIPVGIALSN